MDPLDAVAEWRPVGSRWFLHRPEPLLHERMWGCDLPLPPEQADPDGWHHDGGFDGDGRPVAWRQRGPWDDPTHEVVTTDGGLITVRSASAGAIRTTLDPTGRPVATEYDAFPGAVETYEYDEAGRLVVIHESSQLWSTLLASERYSPGGRLTVEHDDAGPSRIADERGQVVWERPVVPWERTLDEAADAIAAACRDAAFHACDRHGVAAGTPVFALQLTYVDQGSLRPDLSFGLEADRRTWLSEDLDDEELAINLLYVGANHVGINFIETDAIAAADDERLLRAACIQQPADPYRVVLGAVATRLARTDWAPALRPTDDFVVFIAEHDEDFGPMVASIRAHNPPERVARWEASFPLDALDDDEDLEGDEYDGDEDI